MLRIAAPSYKIQEDSTIIDALVGAQLASSKREARQFLADKAVSLNGAVVTDAEVTLSEENFHNKVALLKRGKKNVCVLVLS